MLPWKSDWQQLECRLMGGGGGVGRGLGGGGSQTIRLTVSKCNRVAPQAALGGFGTVDYRLCSGQHGGPGS